MKHILLNVANWHASKACEAYLSGKIDLYCRHIAICDRLHWEASFAPRLREVA